MYYTNRKDHGSYIGSKQRDFGSIRGKVYFFESECQAEAKCCEYEDAEVIACKKTNTYKVQIKE